MSINLEGIKFPHLVISDGDFTIDGMNFLKAPKGYFRKNIHIEWNINQTINNKYYLLDSEKYYLQESEFLKKLTYEEPHVNLPKSLVLNYKIFYKDNGVLNDTAIKTGKITTADDSFKINYDFSKIQDNHRISFLMKIFEENFENSAIILEDNITLTKMEKPKIIGKINYAYNNSNSVRPITHSSGTAFNLTFSSPSISSGKQSNDIYYKVRLKDESNNLILQKGNLQSIVGTNITPSLILPVNYSSIFNTNLTKILSDSKISNPRELNSLFENEILYLEIIDSYGIDNSYQINNKISIDYREPPIFSEEPYSIGIDYLNPFTNGITWKSENVLTNNTLFNSNINEDKNSANKLINEGEYLITIFNKATDLNIIKAGDIQKEEKIYYEIKLLSTTETNKAGEPVNFSVHPIEEKFWADTPDELASKLVLGEKYGQSQKVCIPIQIKNISTKTYYKTELRIFNIEEKDFNRRIYNPGKVESNTYLIGLPTAAPSINIKASSVPKIFENNNNWIASTINEGNSGGQIYTAKLHEWYDKYSNYERKISYIENGIIKNYAAQAELVLQYSTTEQIEDDDGFLDNNFKIVLQSFKENALIQELKRTLSKVKGSLPRLFFRIKIKITSGFNNDGSIKIFSGYSNTIIYYPSGPSVSHRFHSVGINQENVSANNVIEINPYKNKTCLQLNGLKGTTDTSLFFDLKGGVLSVSDINNFNFIASISDIDNLFI